MTDKQFDEEILAPEDEAQVLEFRQKLEDAEVPKQHVLLKVWRDVLANAPAEAQKKVTPQWAMKMVTAYPGVVMQDLEILRDTYFGMLQELCNVLEWEISTDPECLSYTTHADDVEHNGHHYKNLMLQWQLMFLQYELEWECTSEYAAVDIAALSEVHKTLFGGSDRPGLVNFLDNIGFTDTYTEADQDDLAKALEELRGSSE